jgi:mevalonate kinase
MHASNYHVKNSGGGFGDLMISAVRKKRKVEKRILESIREKRIDAILSSCLVKRRI